MYQRVKAILISLKTEKEGVYFESPYMKHRIVRTEKDL